MFTAPAPSTQQESTRRCCCSLPVKNESIIKRISRMVLLLLSTYLRNVPILHPYAWKCFPNAFPCTTGMVLSLPLLVMGPSRGGWGGHMDEFHTGAITTTPTIVTATTLQPNSYFSLPTSSNCESAISMKTSVSRNESKKYIPQPGKSRGTGGQSNLFPRGPSGTRSDQTNPGLWHVSGRQLGR